MPTDTYYRGYRLTNVREGTPTEYIQIRAMGDPDLLSSVPTRDKAEEIIDTWMVGQ